MAKSFSANIVVGGKVNPSLQKTFSKVGNIAKKVSSGVGKAGAIAGKALGVVGGLAGAAGAVVGAATTKMMGGFLENSDALEKMRAQTGLSYNQLQKLQYIGGQLSVSMDSITNAASFMNKNMSAATKNGSDAAAVFKALGVNVRNTTTGALRPQSEVFNESLTALSSISNASERNAMAYKVFGKGAKDILPLLDAGTGEISRMSKEAEKLGLVLSDDAVQAGDNFGDTLEKLKNVATAVGGKLMAGIVPALQKIADSVLANAPMITSVMSDIFGSLGDAFAQILPSLIPLVQQLLPVLSSVLKSLLPVIPPIANFISGLIPLLVPIIQMLAPFIAQFAQTLLPALLEVAQALLPVILQLLQAFMPILKPLLDIISTIVTLIGVGLAKAIEFVMPAIKWLADVVGKVVGGVGGFIGGVKKFFSGGGDNKSDKDTNPGPFPTTPPSPITWPSPTPPPSPMPGFANGGIASRPSIFGEGPSPEIAIPLKRTPRNVGLLNQAAQILGTGSGIQIIYAPQISGANRAEIEPALRSSFELFKAWFEQLQIDNGRMAF